jgi:hypothetical protein
MPISTTTRGWLPAFPSPPRLSLTCGDGFLAAGSRGVSRVWSPAWPPQDTFRQLRRVARKILPGARIRHLLMGRYLLTWIRPLDPAGGNLTGAPRHATRLWEDPRP